MQHQYSTCAALEASVLPSALDLEAEHNRVLFARSLFRCDERRNNHGNNIRKAITRKALSMLSSHVHC